MKNIFKMIDWKNHTASFASVLIGVLVAFSLNSWYEHNKEQQNTELALINIKKELSKNLERIDSAIIANEIQVHVIKEFISLVDDDLKFKKEEDKVLFNNLHPSWKDGFSIEFDLYQLSNVAWSTAERTGVLSAIDFDLALILFEVYDLQSKVLNLDKELLTQMNNSSAKKEAIIKMAKTSELARMFASSLKKPLYQKGIDALIKRLGDK